MSIFKQKFFIFTTLKKIITISFLFFFLFANTELHQLLKLPVLLHHFIDHKETDNTISFLDFVKKHYGEKNSNSHNHNNEHEKLPFKSNDGCGIVHSSIAFCASYSFVFNYQTPVISNNNVNYSENYISSAIQSSIWQPPKTV